MRVCKTKADRRLQTTDNKQKGILNYGESNDYPQKLVYTTSSSGTANKCLNIYKRFIGGAGFVDVALNDLMFNDTQSGKKFLSLIANENAIFNGRCYHLNYNELGQVTDINIVPFEYIRLEEDDSKKLTGRYKYYDDWDQKKRAKFESENVITFNKFNPLTVLSEIESVAGIANYKGQIYYSPIDTYPLSIYDSVISDIATEDNLATIKFRNAANSFFPAGMLVVKKSLSETDGTNSNNDEMTSEVANWQTPEKLGKLIVVEVERDEEKPEFLPVTLKNYDRDFEYTETSIQRNIGSIFMQPGVLRGELIAGKLGSTTDFQDAYQYYNIITEKDRADITEDLNIIFKYWHEPITSKFEIKPLSYGIAVNK